MVCCSVPEHRGIFTSSSLRGADGKQREVNMGSELTFQDRTVVPFDNGDGKIWFTTDALADLLGYANANKVSNIYNRHKDEFTDSMTTVTKVRKDGINNSVREVEMRIFLLPGALASSAYQVAKDLRVWMFRPGRKRIWHSDCPIECLRTCQTYRSADSRSDRFIRRVVFQTSRTKRQRIARPA